MATSIDILNNIRLNASNEYQTRIPEATQQNIASIGQAFSVYDNLYNEFCQALLHKIGKTIINNKMFKNKLARFKSGSVVDPLDVEEIFVEMAKAESAYDPNATNVFGRRELPPVHVIYHRQNRRDKYVLSIGEIDFNRVFRSDSLLTTFIKSLINSVYSADERDEWLAMKNLLATYKDPETGKCGYHDYEVKDMAEYSKKEEFAVDFIKAVRKAVQDMSFLSTEFNVSGVETWSSPTDLVLFINKDVLVEIDVERLAKAFHQSDTDLKVVPTIITMDNFGSLEDTYGLLVDKEWFRVWDTLATMKSADNPDGLFTNYFYHHHQILSASTFKNAVRFKRTSAT